ncbi:MAG: acyl-CoA dehydrogenase family protein [Actinomycetota bacterium]
MTDRELSGEQRAFRDAARAFARAASPATAPRERLRDLGRLGFLGVPLPSAFGGQDGDLLAFCLCLEAFAATDGVLARGVADAVCLGIVPIAALATPDQRRRLLPPLLGGAATAAIATDGGALVRSGEGWALDAPPSPLEGWLPAQLAIRPVEGPEGPALVVLPVAPPGTDAPAARGEPLAAEAVLGPPGRVAAALGRARVAHRIARAAAEAAGDGPHRAAARGHARMVAIDA